MQADFCLEDLATFQQVLPLQGLGPARRTKKTTRSGESGKKNVTSPSSPNTPSTPPASSKLLHEKVGVEFCFLVGSTILLSQSYPTLSLFLSRPLIRLPLFPFSLPLSLPVILSTSPPVVQLPGCHRGPPGPPDSSALRPLLLHPLLAAGATGPHHVCPTERRGPQVSTILYCNNYTHLSVV